jgi:hypothetical protein
VSLGGIDWLVGEQRPDSQTAVTYGLNPAVEVTMSREAELDYAEVLTTLSGIITAAGLGDTGQRCT